MKKFSAGMILLSVLMYGQLLFSESSKAFSISVSGMESGKSVPLKFVRNTVKGGENVSPGISWKNVPAGTKSFAVTCIDIHPIASKWVHWMLLNIAADAREIPEDASLDGKAIEMINSFGSKGYDGPQPPPGSGLHEYVFTVYALSVKTLPVGEKKLSEAEFLRLVKGKILAEASFSAVFGR